MTRRESFQRLALLLGGAAIAPEALANALAAAAIPRTAGVADRLALLDEMAETILPATDTPGAKAAKVGEFILHAVEHCLPEARKQRFWTELDAAAAECEAQFGKSFVQCGEAERIAFFNQLQSRKNPEHESHLPTFFAQLKMLVLHGYFTSEIGATQALQYDPVPGAWISDMIITPDTKAWTPVF
jgi:hypothetical protein